MNTDYNALSNPIGCLLFYLSALKETDYFQKEYLIKHWLDFQSPTQSELNRKVYIKQWNRFKCSLFFLDKLFQEIGWLTHIVLPLLKEKIELLEKFSLVTKIGFDEYEITLLGQELYNKRKYHDYIYSFSFKADFWKDRNVKLYKLNEKGIGSGFFIESNKVVTCKHVYEELKENLKIEDELGRSYTIKELHKHPNENVDLIVISTNESFDKIPFLIGDEIGLIEKVLVYGYPPVPTTTKPFLICNLGEISSKVDNYIEQIDYLVLSCIVKPGNSGGPVINEFGRVVGVATQNISESITIGEMRINEPIDMIKALGYSSALPIKYLKEMINSPNIL